MKRRHRSLLLGVAAAHLGLAVLGALHICLWQAGLPGRVLTWYAALTGVDSGYSYFAPSVLAPARAELTIVDRDGSERHDALASGVMREANIRVEHIIERIHDPRVDEQMRDKIAASWAAEAFARHRSAESVIVDVVRDRLPTMTDLRQGAPIRRQSSFRARVVRAPMKRAERAERAERAGAAP